MKVWAVGDFALAFVPSCLEVGTWNVFLVYLRKTRRRGRFSSTLALAFWWLSFAATFSTFAFALSSALSSGVEGISSVL